MHCRLTPAAPLHSQWLEPRQAETVVLYPVLSQRLGANGTSWAQRSLQVCVIDAAGACKAAEVY